MTTTKQIKAWEQEGYEAQGEECPHCQRLVPALRTVPPASDDVAWAVIQAEHAPDCEWARTRALCLRPDPISYVLAASRDTWGPDATPPVSEDEHARLCAAAEAWLTEHEGDALSICVRPARSGEIAGTYRVRDDGGLQILGCSYPVPEKVERLIGQAVARACGAR